MGNKLDNNGYHKDISGQNAQFRQTSELNQNQADSRIMPKEKKFNPVQAQRKADKAKEIKKGKADVQSRRNEKLAQRNPVKIQEQIKSLKDILEGGGKLTKLEEQSLEALEKDLKAVEKARKALGDKAPTFGRGGGAGNRYGPGGGVLGKRRRDEDEVSSDDSDVPEDVARIPMPRDTPPPIPKPVLDEWFAKRRAKKAARQDHQGPPQSRSGGGTNANDQPLGKDRGTFGGDTLNEQRTEKSATPIEVPRVVYESAPIVRDLRKEAVSAFVPTAVRMKLDKSKGQGGLMEPEEADRLEKEGYLAPSTSGAAAATPAAMEKQGKRTVTLEEVEDEDD